MAQSRATWEAAGTHPGLVVVAGGSFWGLQEALREAAGVVWTRVGYAGGSSENPSFADCGDHAEAVEVLFDPGRIGLRGLVLLFLRVHDPTTVDRQGDDIGTRYRSLVLTGSDRDAEVARSAIDAADASGRWPGPIVTRVQRWGAFWEAEPSHQEHLQRHPDGYNEHYLRTNWRLDD